jgi:diguanylate cyclase (GGDEF)-like protein
MIHQGDLEQARYQAERSRLDAEMQRMRAEQLDRAAHTDALTGLYNRRFLEAQLQPLQERAARTRRGLWAALIDADHFKLINDRFGHAAGDAVLKALAKLISDQSRGSDLAVRYGGEEFVLLLLDTDERHAAEVAERLRQAVQAHPWSELQAGLAVTVSLGLGPLGLEAAPAGELLAAVDGALYRAKRGGRNRVERVGL